MNMDMTLERVREIVEAYGASAHRWPQAEREAALAFVAKSDEAREMVNEALSLDLMLDAAPVAAPASSELVARIMAARPRAVPVATVAKVSGSKGFFGFWKTRLQEIWPYGPPAIPAGALAASIMLGVGFGFSVPTAATALGNLALTSQTASTTSSDLGDQLAMLAFAENQYPQEWQQ